jgi:hypothetical protein
VSVSPFSERSVPDEQAIYLQETCARDKTAGRDLHTAIDTVAFDDADVHLVRLLQAACLNADTPDAVACGYW